MACNQDRFEQRVFSDEGMERSCCRCCGRWIVAPEVFLRTRDTADMDGYCRWCELGHPKRVKVTQAKLLTDGKESR